MADELRIADTTGLTYTCEVRALDGTLIGSPVSLTESASSGRYYGTMTGSAISDTTYDLFFIQNSIIEQAITRHWNGTKLLDLGDVPTAVEVRTEVDSNSTQLAAIVADTNELQTDDVPTLIAALPTAVENRTEMDSNSTQLTAIVADTNELQTDDVPGLIAALNNISTAEVNTEVDTALSDIHLDHLLAVDYDPASKPGTATALLNELIGDDGGVSQFTANALELGPNSDNDYNLLQTTTIATLASQTSFTLTAGSADDDAYNDMMVVVTDASTSTQKAIGFVLDYTGSTKTITLSEDPSVFTMAVGDTIDILAGVSVASIWAYATRTLTSSANVTSSSLSGSRIQLTRFVTFTNTWSGLTVPGTWDKCYFTIKTDSDDDADTAALVQIVVTNGGDAGDGLLYLNGTTATAANGSLVVDEGAGTVLATIADDAMISLDPARNLEYDLKFTLTGGTTQLPLRDGYADIVSTPTRTI